MASQIPCFFLAPTWDFPPPPLGPIKLGSVITSLKMPERALYTPTPDESDMFSSEKRKVSFSTEKLRERKFGIFTKFLSVILGLGADASVNWDKSDSLIFSFDTLSTIQFLPNSSFIKTCITDEAVHRYLTKSRYRKPIYIITGLKIVTGAKAKSTRARGIGGEFKAEVDGTPLGGVPVGAGPAVEASSKDKKDMEWEECDDFVFAFRVRKIMVDRKDGTVKSDEDYKKGAMLDGAVRAPDGTELTVIVEEEADAEQEGYTKEELTDDGELVMCAVPQLPDDDDSDSE